VIYIPRQYINLELFCACESCGCYHPAEFDGDCRDDANRFIGGELDKMYGPDGWAEVQS
jgi:hypothetical protein